MKRALTIFATTVIFISSVAAAQNAVTQWNEIGVTAARASTAPSLSNPAGTGCMLRIDARIDAGFHYRSPFGKA